LIYVASRQVASGFDYIRYVEPTREVWMTEPDDERIEIFTIDNSYEQPVLAVLIVDSLAQATGVTLMARRDYQTRPQVAIAPTLFESGGASWPLASSNRALRIESLARVRRVGWTPTAGLFAPLLDGVIGRTCLSIGIRLVAIGRAILAEGLPRPRAVFRGWLRVITPGPAGEVRLDFVCLMLTRAAIGPLRALAGMHELVHHRRAEHGVAVPAAADIDRDHSTPIALARRRAAFASP